MRRWADLSTNGKKQSEVGSINETVADWILKALQQNWLGSANSHDEESFCNHQSRIILRFSF
jgi:hypothetical protein